MEQKVCLDTDVVIAILNDEERAAKVLDTIEDTEVFITTITLFELLLRETNLEPIEQLRERVQLLPFDEIASRKASYLFKDLRKKGKITDIRDVFIAATIITNQCSLTTFNRKHFEHIKGLKLVC